MITKINNCQTMRELDELRIDIIKAAENGEDFEAMQKAFVKKKNSLRRKGHSRAKEGYRLMDVAIKNTSKEMESEKE